MKKDNYSGRKPFTKVDKGETIEIWMGEPNHPESEFILVIHKSLLPQLIATLKM